MEYSDDYRDPKAAKEGGFEMSDRDMISRYRSAGKEVIKKVGRDILKGKFSLTNFSLPIHLMCPKSIVQALPSMAVVFPYYLNASAQSVCPVERIKLLITAMVAYNNCTHTFEKPLNPILGETYAAELEDGT